MVWRILFTQDFSCKYSTPYYGLCMAELPEDPNREITLNLGTRGTAFGLGMLTGVVAGVVAVILLLNYTRK